VIDSMRVALAGRRALRVAVAATVTVAVIYVLLVAGIVTLVSNRLTHEVDSRLVAQLARARARPITEMAASAAAGHDPDDAPVYFWRVTADEAVTPATASGPSLPAALLTARQAYPRTAQLSGGDFRVAELRLPDGSRLFAAESLAQAHHVRSLLTTAATLLAPFVLAAVFASALTIGWQASKPIELARRRQLEFTADASHELRTPLTVIEAEVGVALAADRSAAGYREALERVAGESHRLRRVVEDLLWLARFDCEPPRPKFELVDITTIARQCANRFEPILRSRDVRLCLDVTREDAAPVAAPPEWIDRLVGVLLDNAIRYAKRGGRVDVSINCTPGHVTLTVADDGPGIPADRRDRLFDRFHRLDETNGHGAGLGLAIADAVVRSTRGRWIVGDSPAGGAAMTVGWPTHRADSTRPDAPRRRSMP
jgi:signal transduction histidine kinase